LRRLEFEKAQEAQAKAAADQAEAERIAMQSIDWCARGPRLGLRPQLGRARESEAAVC
jgi:hypothetical protein